MHYAEVPAVYWLLRDVQGSLLSWGFGWFLCTTAMNVANKKAVGASPTRIFERSCNS